MSYYASITYGRLDIYIKLFIITIPLPREVNYNRGTGECIEHIMQLRARVATFIQRLRDL
jgi:hypothetical protein